MKGLWRPGSRSGPVGRRLGTDRIRNSRTTGTAGQRDPWSCRTGPTTCVVPRICQGTDSLAHRIGIADSTLRPSRPRHHLPDGHRSAPLQHAPDSRPARRANENRLTTVRIDQAPAPGRLNKVETHGVIPGSSVRRPRNRSKTGSRPSPGSHHPTPKSAKRREGKEDSTEKHEEHDRDPGRNELELGPPAAAR